MLRINSINSTIKSQNNKNGITLKKSDSTIKNDVVHFGADVQARTIFVDKQVRAIANQYLTQYSNVLGRKFQRKILTPWIEFLGNHGVYVEGGIQPLRVSTNRDGLGDYLLKSGYSAGLCDENGTSIIYKVGSDYQGLTEPITGVTYGDATLNLLAKLVDGSVELNDGSDAFLPNPLKHVEISRELVTPVLTAKCAVDHFKHIWSLTETDTRSLKVKRLQKALKVLMPEGGFIEA